MAEKPMDLSTDRKKYFCEKIKKHVWVLGYFGGGGINFHSFREVANQLADEIGVGIETININEIDVSRRFKYFKYIFSDAECQCSLPDSIIVDDIYGWLND